MAFLLPAIVDGIVSSNDLSTRHYKDIYHSNSLFKINEKGLAKVVKDHLVAQQSKITQITINEFDEFENNICGMVLINGNHAEIVVNSKLNECWRRFTICKELLQLYCDNRADSCDPYSQDEIVDQLDKLKEAQDKFFSISSETGISGLKKAFVEDKSYEEFIAIAMAIILIFPERDIALINNIFNSINRGEITHFDVALALKMPEYFIIKYYQIFHLFRQSPITPS